MKELDVCQRFVVPRVPVIEELPVPAQGPVVETAFGIEVDGSSVMTLVRCVAQQSLDLGLRASLVAGAPADERSPDIAVQVDRLVLPARLGDVEDQKRLAVVVNQPLVDGDDTVQLLAGTQDAEEIVLDLVDLQDTNNLEFAGTVPDAEDLPAAYAVGKGGDRFISGVGNASLSPLELDVVPLVALETFDELCLLHLRLLQDHPDLGRILSLAFDA